MNKILIEVIVTNQCNKRCEYCDLDFRNKSISDNDIDLFTRFINNSSSEIEYFHLNFFWGEPLLEFSKIKKIVNSISIKNIKYSIWTNWNLLNNDVLAFLYLNDIKISLSVDNITGFEGVYNIDKKYFNLIYINFINDPDFLFKSKWIFSDIINKWYKNINFMPVFSTKKWNKKWFIELWKIAKCISMIKDVKVNFFWYFNWISSDKQFILDTDGYFYNDLDSLLWLQKQYSKIDNSLKNEININTKNIKLDSIDFSLNELIKNFSIREVVRLIFKIPKVQWCEKDYSLIKKILINANWKIWM